MIIYHNPRCRKSREALEIIRKNGIEPEVIEYLKDNLSVRELQSLVSKLGIQPEELVRKGESVFKDKFKGKKLSETEWIKVIAENPILMERPVIVEGEKAVIGRPPTNVEALF